MAWFTEDDYASAVKYLDSCVIKLIDQNKPQEIEFAIKKDRFRPEEAVHLLTLR